MFEISNAYRMQSATPEAAAKQLHRIALDHLNDEHGHRVARLYRIFVYDAPPAEWKGHTPISKQSVDYGPVFEVGELTRHIPRVRPRPAPSPHAFVNLTRAVYYVLATGTYSNNHPPRPATI